MRQTHRARLFAQVGVLAARHRVAIHVRGAGAHVGLEWRVVAAHAFPVLGNREHGVTVDAGVAFAAFQRHGDRTEVGLRGECRSSRPSRRRPHRSRLRSRPARWPPRCRWYRGCGNAAASRPLACRVLTSRRAASGLQTPAMSLMPMMLAPARSNSLAMRDVILEVVFRTIRVEQVAGVADRAFAQARRFRARHPSPPAYFPPSSANRIRGIRRSRLWRPAARNAAPRYRRSWCSRPRWSRATASGTGCSARACAAAPDAPTGLP